MGNRFSVVAAAAALAFAISASAANADVLVQIAYGDPSTGAVTGEADIAHVFGLQVYAEFNYSGPINFQITTGDNTQNTFANFFDFTKISNFSGLVSESDFANLIMSNPGPNDGTCSGAGETGCLATAMAIFGTSAGGNFSVTHDDGASLYTGPSNTVVFEDPDPTVAVTQTGFLPAGDFTLTYVEANGSPSILVANLNQVGAPEPATLSLLGAGLLGFSGIRRKRNRV